MIQMEKLSGRLGNQMFRDAFIYTQMRKGNVPDIYLQDPGYFQEYANEITKRYSEGIGMLPYTAIHLRVGANPKDPTEPKYSENPFYTNLSHTGYYIKALEHFPGGKFIVFSDDIEFAKTYFEGDRFAFDESADDIEAFNKMASCQGLIIANSSYSWWAAYCCPHVDRKIACPSETSWYADKQVRTKVPSDWIQIEP